MKEEIPKQNDSMKYFRSKILGNYCEKCGKVFEDGDIIFTPEQKSSTGEKITRYFCGSPINCSKYLKDSK